MVAGRRAPRPPVVPLDTLSTPVARRAQTGPPRTPATPGTPGTPGTPSTPGTTPSRRGRRPTSWTPAEDEKLAQLVAAEATINRNSVNAAAFARDNNARASFSPASGGNGTPIAGSPRDPGTNGEGSSPPNSWLPGSQGSMQRQAGQQGATGQMSGIKDNPQGAAGGSQVGGPVPMSQAEAASISVTSTKTWSLIASQLPGRTGKQCRERWLNQLKPGINREPWTEEEQRILYEAHGRLGNKWVQIADLLPGRTDNTVKNFFNSAQRKAQRRRAAQQMLERLDAEAVRRLKPSAYSNQTEPGQISSESFPPGPGQGSGLTTSGTGGNVVRRMALNFTNPHQSSSPPPSNGTSPGVSPPSTFAPMASSPSPPPSGPSSPQKCHATPTPALSVSSSLTTTGFPTSSGGYLGGAPVPPGMASHLACAGPSGGAQARNAKLEISHLMSSEPGQRKCRTTGVVGAGPDTGGKLGTLAARRLHPSHSAITSPANSSPASGSALAPQVFPSKPVADTRRCSPQPASPVLSPAVRPRKTIASFHGSYGLAVNVSNRIEDDRALPSVDDAEIRPSIAKASPPIGGKAREGPADRALQEFENGKQGLSVLQAERSDMRVSRIAEVSSKAGPTGDILGGDVGGTGVADNNNSTAGFHRDRVQTRATLRAVVGPGRRTGEAEELTARDGCEIPVRTRGVKRRRSGGNENALNALAMAASSVPLGPLNGIGSRSASPAHGGASGKDSVPH